MKNTNVTTHSEMPAEDRKFYFSMTAATLVSLAIAVLAAEIM